MTCENCKNVAESPNTIHVIRQCSKCGRELRIAEPGDHGIGIKFEKGDKFVIPEGVISLALSPLKSTGRFTQHGLDWFMKKIAFGEISKEKGKIEGEIQRIMDECMDLVSKSELISDLDIQNQEDIKKIHEILGKNTETGEFWAWNTIVFASGAIDAIEKNEIQLGMWAMAHMERSRLMMIYKYNLEEVIWMGQSASRLIAALKVWDSNKNSSDEEFWQITLTEHSYLLSQIFAIPIIFIKDKAYVGGMNMDNKKSRFVDFLCSSQSSKDAILIEIKTPKARILGGKYRRNYSLSRDLSGSIVQVLDYRNQLTKNIKTLTEGTDFDLESFQPRCAIVIGNGSEELNNDDKVRSFELFRRSQSEVEIVTFDELFRKAEILANLFNIIKS